MLRGKLVRWAILYFFAGLIIGVTAGIASVEVIVPHLLVNIVVGILAAIGFWVYSYFELKRMAAQSRGTA